MGWDHSDSREGVNGFMLRFLNIDSEKLIYDAIQQKLKEQNLSFKVSESTELAGSNTWHDFHPQIVTFYDGRTFRERLDIAERWDDEGHDHYAFIEEGTPHETKYVHHEE